MASLHQFHIPVMGLAYTIDSPIKVAQYGIASVMSIVEDNLIEMMRKHYYNEMNEKYHPISTKEEDYRAKRITDYLNLVQRIVDQHIQTLKKEPFLPGSSICKYFELLPSEHPLYGMYLKMLELNNEKEITQFQNYLRSKIVAGSIDVNIMTKVDKNNYSNSGILIEDGSDAVAALRGFANSNLKNSAIIFSAGLNPRLYNYLEKCTAFEPNEDGTFNKRVIIKVSDYRSALIQGKYLAKKGIWVSEFRIESGLNCGGHAFATDGFLLGPILEEFKTNRAELIDSLFSIYKTAIANKIQKTFLYPPATIFSVQGGIGTHAEHDFLLNYYQLQSTGWGTPFLLVPEATTVDEHTLQLLCKAKEKDIILSHNSPLGVRFHYLKGTTADIEKFQRIKNNKPGSPCTEKHLAFNTEFSEEPICTASLKYQQLKLAHLKQQNLSEKEYQKQQQHVLDKECLCVGLCNAAAINYKQTFVKNNSAVNICPGPNIVNFSKIVSLQTMVDHIYGRTNIVTNSNRPNLFIAELNLYINYLKELIADTSLEQFDVKKAKYINSFTKNVLDGIHYYKNLAIQFNEDYAQFIAALERIELELYALNYQYEIV